MAHTRKGAQKLSRASAVLHDLDPITYTSADSWSHAQRHRDAAITVSKVVERTFELMGRRRPGKALVFIIDEVGQHVARSGDKIEDLRATVEEFGKIGKNLLRARKIPAPCWVVVTSQEKLDEVVAAIDARRVDIAKLQDRFRYRVDLAPSDIREVATKRVLAKKPEAEPILQHLFAANQGVLNAALRLERTSRRTEITASDFVQFYPYPPHYIELCICIMAGIRLQPGAPRHYGGSNRTIIKQAYEMLVSDRTAMAHKPLGTLVTLDKVFELVEGNLSNEKRTDIYEIGERFKGDPEDQGWALRVAKVICLLEFLRDLPRTEANIAAFLVDAVGQPAPVAAVEAAVKKLNAAQFIRNTEDGWKLQTAQEKSWETERRGYLEPRPRERNEITRQILRDIFGEAALRTYRYKEYRSFRIGIRVDGAQIGDEGDLPLSLCVVDDAEEMAKRLAEVRDESRQPVRISTTCTGSGRSPLRLTSWWRRCTPPARWSRSTISCAPRTRSRPRRRAVSKTKRTPSSRYQSRLRDKLTQAMEQGTGLFRGVAWDAASLGKNLSEILKKLFGTVVPDLYPKLDLGARPLKGDEAELLLKTVDLKALPQVFYAGENGLGLVVQDGAKLVPNPAADVAKEVLDYLVSEHSYGNKDTRTGRALERRFGGMGYGWDRDMLRLILALLFRAGSIEVTYQGNRFRNYQDPLSRVPFINNVAFRTSLFSPRDTLGLKTLTLAVQQLEDLTGEEVDVEEGAIAAAFKKLAAEELEKLYPLKAAAEAYQLPSCHCSRTSSTHSWASSRRPLTTVSACSRKPGTSSKSIENASGRCVEHSMTTPSSVSEKPERWSTTWGQSWPLTRSLLTSVTIWKLLKACPIGTAAGAVGQPDDPHQGAVTDAYRSTYCDLFDQRRKAYLKAIDELKGRTEWQTIAPEFAASTPAPLTRHALARMPIAKALPRAHPLEAPRSQKWHPTSLLSEALKAAALARLQEATMVKRARNRDQTCADCGGVQSAHSVAQGLGGCA